MATRTISVAGGNYNATAAWDEGSVPTSSDDVVCRADGTSGNLTVTAAAAAKTFDLTNGSGYSGVLTLNTSQALTVSGSVTLAAGMTYAGAGTLIMSTAGSTLTTNGVTISGGFQIGSNSVTLADNVTTLNFTQTSGDSGALTSGSAKTVTITGSLNVTRRVTLTNVSISLTGTGTWTGSATSGRSLIGAVTINTAGTITIASAALGTGSTLTYTAGTINWNSSTFYVAGNMTINGCSSIGTFNAIYVNAASTLTIDSALSATTLTMVNSLTLSGNYAVTVTTVVANGAGIALTRVNSWTITTLQVSQTFTIGGNYAQTIDNVLLNTGSLLKIADGQTLTITTSWESTATDTTTTATVSISSVTATVTSYVVWSGPAASLMLYRLRATDITATSTTPGRVYIFQADTLTRTSGIVGFDLSTLGRFSRW